MYLKDVSSSVIDNVFNEIQLLVIAFGQDGKVLFYNKTAEEICGANIGDLRYEDIFFQEFRANDDKESKLKYECWIGRRCYSITDFYVNHDELNTRFVSGHDVTDVKNYILNYNNQSMVDPMTGVFNRQVGIDFLNEMMNQVKLGEDTFSVAFFDLDKLKHINDSFGHSKGDDYIFAVCEVVKTTIRKTDVFSRVGGDEFLLIFPQCTTEAATTIMSKIIIKLDEINKTLPPGIVYRISYGVQDVDQEESISTEGLMNSIDNKMYVMKADNQAKDNMN